MSDIQLSLADKLAPERSALLVIDMQNDFCAEGGYLHNMRPFDEADNVALAGRIMDLVRRARDRGVPVIWIMANYDPKHLAAPALAKRIEASRDAICCEGGTWGWDFFAVEAAEGEAVVEKHSYNGFNNTNLDDILKSHGVETLVITGVATNVCVESTLREGYFRGYYVVVPEDCVACGIQELHDGALNNFRLFFGDVVPSGDILELWPNESDESRLEETG